MFGYGSDWEFWPVGVMGLGMVSFWAPVLWAVWPMGERDSARYVGRPVDSGERGVSAGGPEHGFASGRRTSTSTGNSTVTARLVRRGSPFRPAVHPVFVTLDLAVDPSRGREIIDGWSPPESFRRVW